MPYKIKSLAYFVCLVTASVTYYNVAHTNTPTLSDAKKIANVEANTIPNQDNVQFEDAK